MEEATPINEQPMDYATHPRQQPTTPPTVCVAVEGGIAFATGTNIDGVEMIVWDWDNYKGETPEYQREMLDAETNPFARQWLGLDDEAKALAAREAD